MYTEALSHEDNLQIFTNEAHLRLKTISALQHASVMSLKYFCHFSFYSADSKRKGKECVPYSFYLAHMIKQVHGRTPRSAIRDWNDLPDSLISSAEMSDDCVSKFATLVRSRG